jgi:hypothetical protein
MPGRLETIADGWARGWARHPLHAGYPMTVHALAAGRVVATGLADMADRADGVPGFAVQLGLATDPERVQILLGETDEVLAPPGRPRLPPRLLTVEDLIATPTRRAWVRGACHIDALHAGLLAETIIDLLCRDHLGRPPGPVVMATALAQLETGGFDGVRRMLLNSSEYKYRRLYADAAPGAIFSQTLILAVAARDFTTEAQRAAKVTQVSATPLLELDDAAFVAACYRSILRKEPDRAGMSHYRGQLAAGISKVAIIRHLSNEFETISAGITITDLPQEA